MINGSTRPYQLYVPMATRIEITFTMIATHHAHERILQSPIATAIVTMPSRSSTAPMTPMNAASGPYTDGSMTAPDIAETAMRPRPTTISASPARNDKIARIATPIGRFGGICAGYIPGGAIGGGIDPEGGIAIENLQRESGEHYINIVNKKSAGPTEWGEMSPLSLS